MQITTKKGVWRGGGGRTITGPKSIRNNQKRVWGKEDEKKNNIEARHPWKRIQLDTAGIKWGFTTKKKTKQGPEYVSEGGWRRGGGGDAC